MQLGPRWLPAMGGMDHGGLPLPRGGWRPGAQEPFVGYPGHGVARLDTGEARSGRQEWPFTKNGSLGWGMMVKEY